MKIDCYNASGCPISELEFGDNFYYDNVLYIKVDGVFEMPGDFTVAKCGAVRLDTGMFMWLDETCNVIYADCKVVANSKEIE